MLQDILKRVIEVFSAYRGFFVLSTQLGLVALSNFLAFWLRFDGNIPDQDWQVFLFMLPWLLVIRGVTFVPFGLYRGLWRYTGMWDLKNIVLSVSISTIVFFLFVHGLLGLTHYPRSVFIIDALLLITFLSGIRLLRQMGRELRSLQSPKRVLIFGAGDAGEMIVRDMKHNPNYEFQAVGFIDDDLSKVGRSIHGIKVLGTREVLPKVLNEQRPDAILVAIPSATPSTINEIVQVLQSFKVPIQTLPNFRHIIGGKVSISQIRELSIEDLLDRAPVGLSPEPLKELIGGKRVLVTGAAGSIGSELCRQILTYQPSILLAMDRHENGMFDLLNELEARQDQTALIGVIGDVTDSARVNSILASHQPELIFHAAAHKHVPLMEGNPCEAVKNNILGTWRLACAAQQFRVQRFVLISTDKAVNPVSVMGATKRVAEIIIRTLNRSSEGVFTAVRFGNVLGSNGSVVPRLLSQIKAGGPVTVTHPEMRRYFMVIPEAVQLVLQAAASSAGGETFVLQMGHPVRIVDLARNLIRLSGFVPEEEIAIAYTGLRPGEKLYEELVEEGETTEPSSVPKVMKIIHQDTFDHSDLSQYIRKLEEGVGEQNSLFLMNLILEMVPTFVPKEKAFVTEYELPTTNQPSKHSAKPRLIYQGGSKIPSE